MAITRKRTSISDDGTLLDSSWEKEVYNFCIRNNIPIERNIPINFEIDGEERVTFIDFKIDNMLFEVKASHLLKGCFDYNKDVRIEDKINVYRNNKVYIITDYKELFDEYKDLIGIDIKLFTNPQFPFRDDLPECFYKVKVNHCDSIYDAFYNEKLMWEMIKNRIKYMGGYIDASQIVRALNVTKKAKQPSIFNKTFAEHLIKTYITSDTIVDSFAGWGGRYEAAKKLQKTYIGCDLNPELVSWHQSKGHNVILFDAKDFKYNDSCSVLICPPYKDIEIYFDDQDITLSECDWLKIVMKNIPNANEYVMVCKTVDDEFKPYIVETKTNKSHFGVNLEYVVKIENSLRDNFIDV